SGVTGTGTTSPGTTSSGGTTITGNYAQSYTGGGRTGCPFQPGDPHCRGELLSGGVVVCYPC
ncbi:MAG: hypothetical protein M3319_05135, partial [Actinomycetota bacterium]|nr:hypothetical protein [Actinomycetota bacterium]